MFSRFASRLAWMVVWLAFGGASLLAAPATIESFITSAPGWKTSYPDYPPSAPPGLAGESTLQVTTDHTGRIKEVRLVEKTGIAALDKHSVRYAKEHWYGPPNSATRVPVIYVHQPDRNGNLPPTVGLAEYQRIIGNETREAWYNLMNAHGVEVRNITVAYHFKVDSSGRVSALKLTRGNRKYLLAKLSAQALVAAHIPPMPEKTLQTLREKAHDSLRSFVEVDFDFTVD